MSKDVLMVGKIGRSFVVDWEKKKKMGDKKEQEQQDDGAEADGESKDNNDRKEEKRRRKAEQMDQILNSLANLTRSVNLIEETQNRLTTSVNRLEETVNRLEETQKLLILNQEILQVRATNSTIGRDERIRRVRNKHGVKPPREIFPLSIHVLIMAGNETSPGFESNASSPLPVSRLVNTTSDSLSDDNSDDSEKERRRRNLKWNAELSEKLLDFYEEPWQKHRSGSDSDTPYITSRSRRLKVAQVLGITKTQLNFAQISL
jgi:hypothetical protein